MRRSPLSAFVPLTTYAMLNFRDFASNYSWGWLHMLVRRKPGVSAADASADLTHAYAWSWNQEREMDPSLDAGTLAHPTATASPLQHLRGPEGGRDASIVLWISGVAGIVLLIACANVANLLLGRAFGRRREIAVRLALGVTRKRLIAQLLTESLLLALLAGVAGILIGEGGQSVLRSLFLPDTATVGVLDDPRTIVFAAFVALFAGLLTGLAPAFQSGRSDLTTALKSGVREGGPQRSRVRSGLLLVQGALSVFLLVGAGLFVRSLHNIVSVRLGYDVDPILYVALNLRGLKLEDKDAYLLSSKIAEESRAIPGVDSSSQVETVPFYRSRSRSFSVTWHRLGIQAGPLPDADGRA